MKYTLEFNTNYDFNVKVDIILQYMQKMRGKKRSILLEHGLPITDMGIGGEMRVPLHKKKDDHNEILLPQLAEIAKGFEDLLISLNQKEFERENDVQTGFCPESAI